MEEKMGRIIIDGKILDLDKIDLVELKKIQKNLEEGENLLKKQIREELQKIG